MYVQLCIKADVARWGGGVTGRTGGLIFCTLMNVSQTPRCLCLEMFLNYRKQ